MLCGDKLKSESSPPPLLPPHGSVHSGVRFHYTLCTKLSLYKEIHGKRDLNRAPSLVRLRKHLWVLSAGHRYDKAIKRPAAHIRQGKSTGGKGYVEEVLTKAIDQFSKSDVRIEQNSTLQTMQNQIKVLQEKIEMLEKKNKPQQLIK